MSKFDFEWKQETVNPDDVNLDDYELVYIPKENIPVLHDQCKICIHNHVKKYQNYIDEGEQVGNRFLVKCQGIVNKDFALFESILGDKDAAEELLSFDNPVIWAKRNCTTESDLPWKARFYQDVSMRCTANRKVSRMGRRCLAGDTLVLKADGSWCPIKDLQIGDQIIARNEKAQPVQDTVTDFMSNGIRRIYRLKLSDGTSLDLSANHPLLTHSTENNKPKSKWLSIEDGLKEGIKVSVLKQYGTEQDAAYFQDTIIDSVEYLGEQEAYDITVKDNHNFIANGIVSSNSGKSDALAVMAIFAAITQPFFVLNPETGEYYQDTEGKFAQRPTKVLVVTPRQTHSDNLAEKIEGFIHRNPLLEGSLESHKKSPYHVFKFTNKSWIKLLTAGAGTASSGVGVRSFDADLLIVDEGNYLDEETITAMKAILATDVACKLWVCSTPKGMQDFFWEWCNEYPTFKEFHYPTSCLPHWNQIKHDIESECQTEDEFLHEYMAEFSPASAGVFRIDLVKRASQPYHYDQTVPDSLKFVYSIGVDWNSNAGTEIVVVGHSLESDKFIVVDAVNISKAKWTQLIALETIIKLGEHWDPKMIYVDAGYGAVQIELLQMMSEKAAEIYPNSFKARIKDILRVYEFGGKIEVRHPISGLMLKKAAKPYLVNNAVRRFEEERVIISQHDSLLFSQLNHYIIKSISVTGSPTYESDNPTIGDHRLDALMLALVGFTLELSEFAPVMTQAATIGLVEGTRNQPDFSRAFSDFEGNETESLMKQIGGRVYHVSSNVQNSDMNRSGGRQIRSPGRRSDF